MTIRIGINGFGRIGRGVFRAGFKRKDIEFVGINDITNSKTLAHLLKYDSAHGSFPYSVKAVDEGLEVDGKYIPVSAERDPANIPWNKWEVDYVIESTGLFRKYDLASKHLSGNVKRVLISAPGKGGPVKTFVLGVNEHLFNPEEDKIISNASCTTNCYAPVTKVIDDNFGVEGGFMTTVHSYTSDQRILDAPHGDLRRARSAAMNIIPTSTGAAIAVGKVLPHLEGKLEAMSIRVPSPNVSLIDAVYTLKNKVRKEEILDAFREATNGKMKGILAISEEPLVSIDYNGSPHSAIVDFGYIFANGNQIKVVAWYDNETGYSNRMIDLVEFISKKEN
ncbi:MAG: type I glyceraldehyde-3-phosphate dehydrogenase [Candidatus Heimdallarchaeum endolithica]|uniref:glyceraldehyde-3-phosphate dehydrogenase (NAD(P)(+)) (phosphorylating) n=1 Tax=Candidatus Heimdallarchaeum endolithica TaxID=2876572 RepID=A0A9Y1FQF5_9ARCH|nr:MAG: type I glyceraldehyde-3-phosphate dehydrogenase [Candidatus Heimdallarchaeum endolithica]